MKKGLLFAGAFNPPTIAHVQCALTALRQTKRDYVMFVPSKETYIRFDQKKDFVYSDRKRYAMLTELCKAYDEFSVSDYELQNDHQPRTYETLCALKKQGFECSLLFGTDKLAELSSAWKHVEEIASEFGIVCMKRNHVNADEIIAEDPLLTKIKDHIEIVCTDERMQDVSSSLFRKLMKEGKTEEALQMLPSSIRNMKEINLL